MSLSRNVSVSSALRYQGHGPYLTYILHRVGGIGMAVFVTTHVLASFVENKGWKLGFFINLVYESAVFQLIMLFLVFFHAINGLRITILDLFPKLMLYHRQAIAIEWVAFVLVYGFAAFAIVRIAAGF